MYAGSGVSLPPPGPPAPLHQHKPAGSAGGAAAQLTQPAAQQKQQQQLLVCAGLMDWTAPYRLRRSTPTTSTHHAPLPHAHLFRACCQQCPQVLACVVDGLLTQLPQVGGQEALDSEGGVLKGQQRARAVAQQLGQLCMSGGGRGWLRAARRPGCVCWCPVKYLCWVHAPAQCARAACPSSWSARSYCCRSGWQEGGRTSSPQREGPCQLPFW